jgi:hypothetical protein
MKKMVHKLPISLTHATSVYDNHMMFPKIIQRILPTAANHAKKASLKGALVRQPWTGTSFFNWPIDVLSFQ